MYSQRSGCMRYLSIPVLTLVLIIGCTTQSTAGVIVINSDYVVTQWTSTTFPVTYYFYKGSYNDHTDVIAVQPDGVSDALAGELATDLNDANVPPPFRFTAFTRIRADLPYSSQAHFVMERAIGLPITQSAHLPVLPARTGWTTSIGHLYTTQTRAVLSPNLAPLSQWVC